MRQNISFQEMLRHTLAIFTRPRVATFRRCGMRGGRIDAALYVGAAALILAFVNNMSSLHRGVMDIVTDVIITLIGFFFLAWIVSVVGAYFRGRGNLDEVVYMFALFYAPLLMLRWIVIWLMATLSIGLAFLPYMNLLFLLVQAFLSYQAIQASMYFSRRSSAFLTLGGAVLVLVLISMILNPLTPAGI